ncbi:MAG: hypothetical protein M3146_09250 [Thermoproteota archaeon]|nr:hypothetical protein [Thermoproteota archaeon]
MNKSIATRLVILIPIVFLLLPSNSLISSDQLMMADDSYNLEIKNGKNNTPFTTVQDLLLIDNQTNITGAYIPDTFRLEDMDGSDQRLAILEFLEQGFNEYYFVMDNFRDPEEVKSTEKLLDAADNTELKIVIILLPPSEGGPRSSYDWKGWVSYFNELKTRHSSSFSGFAIDDFNWISTRNDTRFWRNIDFMLDSNLTDALKGKRSDVKFCPVVYFEGLRNGIVATEYGEYIDTIILVSASYYNVSRLETNLMQFKELFPGKPTRYIVYPTITYNYTRQGYDPPSDRLVMATLSIATRSVDGIILWHKIDGHLVQDYLDYRENPNYLRALYVMEQLQIADEKNTFVQLANKQITASNFSQLLVSDP